VAVGVGVRVGEPVGDPVRVAVPVPVPPPPVVVTLGGAIGGSTSVIWPPGGWTPSEGMAFTVWAGDPLAMPAAARLAATPTEPTMRATAILLLVLALVLRTGMIVPPPWLEVP
jgi:hypothetical protein